ncbi:putative MO25-like protein [Zea mays]|uniref:Putative MO25-like protein n=2 Tax=Zea mays TaxID=4577 RepID=A0A1D6II16_MAIZE|nr:Putative MO25-like protein [Zea mays]PWZ15387.1 putative MO25-like protein [Zea mays]
MKGLFKSKPRTPVDIVRQTRECLVYLDLHSDSRSGDAKREEKMTELSKNIRDMKSILYGNGESEPVTEACVQLTQEFFRENTLRLLIIHLPKLNLETRKDATQVVANLQRQQVSSKIVASEYLESNKDLLDILILGYENMDIALHYGAMLRECIRHQSIASKNIQIEAFHVFKLFAANKNKPPEVVNILVTNRSKLLRFFAGFKIDKEDEQFEADKEQVIKEISAL